MLLESLNIPLNFVRNVPTIGIQLKQLQSCQNFRAPARGYLPFLPAARDFKVAQFLLRNYTLNFPNLGAFLW